MRSYTAPELTYLQNREGYINKALLWFAARNRTTNAVETMGIWTGDDDAVFTIGAESRTYLAGGLALGLDPIIMQTGLVVRSQRLRLAAFPAEVQTLILTYDLGLAPAQIHRASFSPDTGALIAEPRRIWKGYVDRAPLPTAQLGGEAEAEVILTSTARELTRGLTLTHSDATQRLRGDDRFLKFADVAGVVRSPWGQNMPAVATTTPRPPPSSNFVPNSLLGNR